MEIAAGLGVVADRVFFSFAFLFEAGFFVSELLADVFRFRAVSGGLGGGELGFEEDFALGDLGSVFFVDLGEQGFLFLGYDLAVSVFGGEAFHGEFVSGLHVIGN